MNEKRTARKARRIAASDSRKKTRNIDVTVIAQTVDGTVHRIKSRLIGEFIITERNGQTLLTCKPGTYQNTVKHATAGIDGTVVRARIMDTNLLIAAA